MMHAREYFSSQTSCLRCPLRSPSWLIDLTSLTYSRLSMFAFVSIIWDNFQWTAMICQREIGKIEKTLGNIEMPENSLHPRGLSNLMEPMYPRVESSFCNQYFWEIIIFEGEISKTQYILQSVGVKNRMFSGSITSKVMKSVTSKHVVELSAAEQMWTDLSLLHTNWTRNQEIRNEIFIIVNFYEPETKEH